jgi:putative GTP pyrophosphokinase
MNMDHLEEEMQDIAGLRIMVQFVENINVVLNLLRLRQNFKIVYERDYITNKKNSDYRLVIEYPVQTLQGEKKF